MESNPYITKVGSLHVQLLEAIDIDVPSKHLKTNTLWGKKEIELNFVLVELYIDNLPSRINAYGQYVDESQSLYRSGLKQLIPGKQIIFGEEFLIETISSLSTLKIRLSILQPNSLVNGDKNKQNHTVKIVGEATLPISRLEENVPATQWYQLMSLETNEGLRTAVRIQCIFNTAFLDSIRTKSIIKEKTSKITELNLTKQKRRESFDQPLISPAQNDISPTKNFDNSNEVSGEIIDIDLISPLTPRHNQENSHEIQPESQEMIPTGIINYCLLLGPTRSYATPPTHRYKDGKLEKISLNEESLSQYRQIFSNDDEMELKSINTNPPNTHDMIEILKKRVYNITKRKVNYEEVQNKVIISPSEDTINELPFKYFLHDKKNFLTQVTVDSKSDLFSPNISNTHVEPNEESEIILWDRLPKSDHPDLEMPSKIEWFACPEGPINVVSSVRPNPFVFSFILSSGNDGENVYGISFNIFIKSNGPILIEDSDIFLSEDFDDEDDGEDDGEEDNDEVQSEINGSDIFDEVDSNSYSPSYEFSLWKNNFTENFINKKKKKKKFLWTAITLCILYSQPYHDEIQRFLFLLYKNSILNSLISWEKKRDLLVSNYFSSVEGDSGNKKSILSFEFFKSQYEDLMKNFSKPFLININNIINFFAFNCPTPLPKLLTINLNFTIYDKEAKKDNSVANIQFKSPNPSGFPISSSNNSFILSLFGARSMVDILCCILSESRILFYSNDLSKIYRICEGFRSLIYPLSWSHVYLPVVPIQLLNLIEAPVPFLLGTHADNLNVINSDILNDIILIDCDSGTINKFKDKEQNSNTNYFENCGYILNNSESLCNFKFPEKEDKWLVMSLESLRTPNSLKMDVHSLSFSSIQKNSFSLDQMIHIIIYDVLFQLLRYIPDCLFFLNPSSPVFNCPLFLSEYTPDEFKECLSILTLTNSFQILTETVHTPSLSFFYSNIQKVNSEEREFIETLANDPIDKSISKLNPISPITNKIHAESPMNTIRALKRQSSMTMLYDKIFNSPNKNIFKSIGPLVTEEFESQENFDKIQSKNKKNERSLSPSLQRTFSFRNQQININSSELTYSSSIISTHISPTKTPSRIKSMHNLHGAHTPLFPPPTGTNSQLSLLDQISILSIPGNEIYYGELLPYWILKRAMTAYGEKILSFTSLIELRLAYYSNIINTKDDNEDELLLNLECSLNFDEGSYEVSNSNDSIIGIVSRPLVLAQFSHSDSAIDIELWNIQKLSKKIGKSYVDVLDIFRKSPYSNIYQGKANNFINSSTDSIGNSNKSLKRLAFSNINKSLNLISNTSIDSMDRCIIDFLQQVVSSTTMDSTLINDGIEKSLKALEKSTNRHSFVNMLKHAKKTDDERQKKSQSQSHFYPLNSIAFDVLSKLFHGILNICSNNEDYVIAFELLEIGGRYYQISVLRTNLESEDADITDESNNREESVEFLSENICHHHIFQKIGFWEQLLQSRVSPTISNIPAHATQKSVKKVSSTLLFSEVRSILQLMIGMGVNSSRALNFIQNVAMNFSLSIEDYFKLQRLTNSLWLDSGDETDPLFISNQHSTDDALQSKVLQFCENFVDYHPQELSSNSSSPLTASNLKVLRKKNSGIKQRRNSYTDLPKESNLAGGFINITSKGSPNNNSLSSDSSDILKAPNQFPFIRSDIKGFDSSFYITSIHILNNWLIVGSVDGSIQVSDFRNMSIYSKTKHSNSSLLTQKAPIDNLGLKSLQCFDGIVSLHSIPVPCGSHNEYTYFSGCNQGIIKIWNLPDSSKSISSSQMSSNCPRPAAVISNQHNTQILSKRRTPKNAFYTYKGHSSSISAMTSQVFHNDQFLSWVLASGDSSGKISILKLKNNDQIDSIVIQPTIFSGLENLGTIVPHLSQPLQVNPTNIRRNSLSSISSNSIHNNLSQLNDYIHSTKMVSSSSISSLAFLNINNQFHQTNNTSSFINPPSNISWLGIGTEGGIIGVVDLYNPSKPVFKSQGHASNVINFLPLKQNQFLTCGSDRSIKLWDLRQKSKANQNTGVIINSISSHSPNLSGINLGINTSINSSNVFSSANLSPRSNFSAIWEPRGLGPNPVFKSSLSPLTQIAVGGWDNSLVIAGNAEGIISIWDMRYDLSKPVTVIHAHSDRVTGIEWRGGGEFFSSSFDGTIKSWNSISGNCTNTILNSNKSENFLNGIIDMKISDINFSNNYSNQYSLFNSPPLNNNNGFTSKCSIATLDWTGKLNVYTREKSL